MADCLLIREDGPVADDADGDGGAGDGVAIGVVAGSVVFVEDDVGGVAAVVVATYADGNTQSIRREADCHLGLRSA